MPIREDLRYRGLRAAVLALALLCASGEPAGSEIVLSDPESEVYYDFAVVAGGQIQVEEGTDVTGDVHSNDKIDLKPESRVTGEVSATGEIIGDGTVSGSVQPGAAPLALPQLGDPSSLRQLADRVFSGDQVLTDEVVDDVVFVEGKVEVFGSLDGVGTIIATAEINLMDGAVALAAETRLSLISYKHIEVGKDRPIRAVLRAQEFVIVEEGATVEGVVVADREVTVKKNSIVVFVDFDEVPPDVKLLTPEGESFLPESPPEITVSFSDDLSGIDAATVELLLDGVDRTADAALSETRMALPVSERLAEGEHTVEIAVSDHSGKRTRTNFRFTVDSEPPILGIAEPLEPVLRKDPVRIAVGYFDSNSGIALSSLSIRLDGDDLTASCQGDPTSATCLLSGLAAGAHTVEAELRDRAGNPASDRRDFTLVTDEGMQNVRLGSRTDTYLSGSRPNDTQGREPIVRVGGTEVDRTLVRFDRIQVARAVGTGTLAFARLELFVEANEGGWGSGVGVEIHRLLEEWVESDATWNCALGTASGLVGTSCDPQWSGGNFAPAPTDVVTHSDATDGWVSFDVTADVLDLLAGGSDHGWLVKKGDEAAGGAVIYASRESSDGRAPRLALEFEAVAGTDLTPPALRMVSPASGLIVGNHNQQLVIEYLDLASEVDLATLKISFDGEDRTASCMVGSHSTFCPLPDLTTGHHTVEAAVSDTEGNRSTLAESFDIIFDTASPVLVVTSPAAGALLNQPTIEVTGTVSDDSGIASVQVEGLSVTPVTGAFSAAVTLSEGRNTIQVEAVDTAGRRAVVQRGVILDTRPPDVRLTPFLPPTQVTNAASFTIAGDAQDFNGINSVMINGDPATLIDGHFEATVSLQEGTNVLVLSVSDPAGNVTSATFEVTRFTTPEVAVAEPVPLTLIGADTVQVSGTVSAGATVSVQGVAATVVGDTFTAPGVSLREGSNILTAVATDAAGHSATASVTVIRDRTPPRVVITSPAEGASIAGSVVTVTGLVSDPLGGLDPATEVTVNGAAASVMNNAFVAQDVPLASGDNLLVAMALDSGGNAGQARVTVRRRDPAGGRIEVFSGNHQTATVGTALPAPLVARLTDTAGAPVPGETVLFSLRGNNGALDGDRRRVAVVTDADGLAQTSFTLGTRAGAGEQVVAAVAAGFAGPASFFANALPAEPALVFVDSGDQQVGCPGQPLPSPFAVVVTDASFNRVAGVEVIFRVALGDGVFGNGQPEITVTTDPAGEARAVLTTGSSEGIAHNVVRAELAANPGGDFASFVASTLAALDPAETAVSGLVLDNTDLPIPGVTMRIEGTSLEVETDETGFFRIAPAPVGTLRLVADGSTAQRPGRWPTLSFVLVTVPGRDNNLGRAIPLLPLNEQGVVVDETHGGTLTLPEVPGFALEIAPGSVTFPGGSRSGEISVTVVHSDKVPMTPNFGQQPRFVISIQPANAVFDPPARLTLPNVDGLEPGRVTEMYSFDHDAERFVTIGTGTVSDDGTVIVSDPGVGVIKAGWHCGGDPASSGTPHDCPICNECDGDKCVPIGKALGGMQTKQQQDCDDGNDCTNDFCEDGNCVHEPLDDTPCGDDGNPCTEDICDNGTCTHPEITCPECQRCDGGLPCVADPGQDGDQCMDEGDPSCSIDRCQNGTCAHPPLTAVDAFGPPDPPALDIAGLNAGTQDALACLQQAVANAGGNMTVNSAFRPQAYQDHLRELWDRHRDYLDVGAQGYNEAECNQIIQNIETEWARHGIVARPARVSNHSLGNAFDATVNLPPGQDIDTLAAGCDLNRPFPNRDPVHFEH